MSLSKQIPLRLLETNLFPPPNNKIGWCISKAATNSFSLFWQPTYNRTVAQDALVDNRHGYHLYYPRVAAFLISQGHLVCSVMVKLPPLWLPFCIGGFSIERYSDDVTSEAVEVVNIGAIFSLKTSNGMESQIAMGAAVEDINSNPSLPGGRVLSLQVYAANYSVILSILRALPLMAKDIVAIIGTHISVLAQVLSYLANEVHVPLLSFTALDPMLSPTQYPYFLQKASNDLFQMTSIAEIISYVGIILKTHMIDIKWPIWFKADDRSFPSIDVINVVGSQSRLIGYWSNHSGILVVPPKFLNTRPWNRSWQQLDPVVWPGLVVLVPVMKLHPSVWASLWPFTPSMWAITAAFFLLLGAVVWILEPRINDEFRGPLGKQVVDHGILDDHEVKLAMQAGASLFNFPPTLLKTNRFISLLFVNIKRLYIASVPQKFTEE
ncbi:hypothetical protein Nepgr_026355 [Nepenthes gracilis]|uniref:Receptor ligand binding region domain-containing protein n=1 Tax=Nepenthes gracilis TaxID=150966 RepID=A0AAD3T9K8_NEPGR|nr:hypothetical protein Nepgr_026355 [Nepenthes gracilis]